MSYIRQRWRQQPQGAVQIDWGNPLSRGLIFAQVGNNLRDLVSGNIGTLNGSYNHTASRYGSGMDLALTGYITYPNVAQYMPQNNAVSILTIARPNNGLANNSSGTFFGRSATDYAVWGIGFSISNYGSNYLDYGIRNEQGSSYGGSIYVSEYTVYNNPFVISMSGATGFPVKAYSSGVLKSTGSTLNNGFRPSGLLGMGIGTSNGSSANANGRTFLNLAWNRMLSDAEHYEIGNNPWQIFKPQQSILISLPELYTAIDETVSDRTDYILSSTAGQVYQTTLSPVAQPGAGTNIDFNFDAESPVDSGSIKFDLLSGATTVKSQTVSLVRNWAGRIRSPQLRQQPQGAVQIDWNHPIARGLVGAWTGSSPNVNLVSNAQLTGGSAWIAPGRNGFEYAPPAGINGFQLLTSAQTPTGQACATLLYRKRDSTNRESAAFGASQAPVERFHAHLPYNDGIVYFDFGGYTGTNRVSVAGLTFGNDVWSFNNSPTGLQIWQNGILRASNNSASQTRTGGTGISLGGIGASAYGDAANTAVFLVHSRALTSSEIVSLANNPWQLFRPASRAVCFPSPAQTSFSITPSDYSVIDTPQVGRFLPQRWRQQPQGAVQIDWSNPITRGLFFFASPAAVSNETKGASIAIRPRQTLYGRSALAFEVVSTISASTDAPYFALNRSVTSSDWTFHTVLSKVDGNFQVGVVLSSGNTHRVMQSISSSTRANDYFGPGQSDWTYTGPAISSVPTNSQFSITVSTAEAKAARYINGVLAIENSLTAPASTTIDNVRFFRRLDYPDPAGVGNAIALSLVFARKLSATEIQSLTENPWQIFRPATGHLYGLPPAGGWPWTPTLKITSL